MKKEYIENTLKTAIVGECGLVGFSIYKIISSGTIVAGFIPIWFLGLIGISIFTLPLSKSVNILKDNLKSDNSNDLSLMISDLYEENDDGSSEER